MSDNIHSFFQQIHGQQRFAIKSVASSLHREMNLIGMEY